MPNTLGADLGNLQTKVAGKTYGATGVYPAGLSVKSPDQKLGDLDAAPAATRDIIEYEEGRWVIDPAAITSTDFERFSEWPISTRAALLYALAQIKSNTRKFDVVIGAPLDVLNEAEVVRTATADVLHGEHHIVVNGEKFKITIGNTTVVSQPKAAIVTAPDWREKRTLLIDWGFVTLHLAMHSHDGKRSVFDARGTKWARLGAKLAAGELARHLNEIYMQYGLMRRVSDHEADAILNGAPAELPGNESIDALRLKLLDDEFQRMVDYVEANTTRVAPNQLYFVGGCAARHRARIMARWGSMAVVPPKPLFSVAEGLLEIGKGLGKAGVWG